MSLFECLPVEILNEILIYLLDSEHNNICLINKLFKDNITNLELIHGRIIIFTETNIIKYIESFPPIVDILKIGRTCIYCPLKFTKKENNNYNCQVYTTNNSIWGINEMIKRYKEYKYCPREIGPNEMVYLPDSLTIEGFIHYHFDNNLTLKCYNNFISKCLERTYNYYVKYINDSDLIGKDGMITWYKDNFYTCQCHRCE